MGHNSVMLTRTGHTGQGQRPSLQGPGQGLDLQGQALDSQGPRQGQGLIFTNLNFKLRSVIGIGSLASPHNCNVHYYYLFIMQNLVLKESLRTRTSLTVTYCKLQLNLQLLSSNNNEHIAVFSRSLQRLE